MNHHEHSGEGTGFLILLIAQMSSYPVAIMLMWSVNLLFIGFGFAQIVNIDECIQAVTHIIQFFVAVGGAFLVRYKWINREKK